MVRSCKYLFFSFCLVFSTNLLAQQPSYFLFGAQEFKGVQIYDVIQDENNNYWFATDEGLYFYDYIQLQKIDCADAKTRSVFGFVKDRKGHIYCHNLNYQVFCLYDKKCRLIYELDDEDVTSYMYLSIGDDDNLVVASKNILILQHTGKLIHHFDLHNKFLQEPFQLASGKVIVKSFGDDFIYTYSHGKLSQKKLINPDAKKMVLSFFKFNGEYFTHDYEESKNYKLDTLTFSLTLEESLDFNDCKGKKRIYGYNDWVWVAGTLKGVHQVHVNSSALDYNYFYNNYFISDVYQNSEGNFMLSTFDQGIIIIPDLSVPDVFYSDEDDPVTSMTCDTSLVLYMGSSKGNLLQYKNGEIENISTAGKRPVLGIYTSPLSEWVVFDDGMIKAYNKKSKKIFPIYTASLKDAVFKSENEIYLGTNSGIYKTRWNSSIQKFEIDNLNFYDKRIYFLEYTQTDSVLYASTSIGLFAIDESGKNIEIKYHDKDIFPNQMLWQDGKLIVLNKTGDFMIIRGNKVVRYSHPDFLDPTDEIRKIKSYRTAVIANTKNGFYEYNSNGEMIRFLNPSFELHSKKVIDFDIIGHHLFVSHPGGVQELNPEYSSALRPPVLRMEEIRVNSKSISTATTEFSSDQRKFTFLFTAPTLLHRETVHYYYRLAGYEKNWVILGSEDNQVTYNALSPGSYTFEVKAEQRGKFSKVYTYSFVIHPPIFLQFWFLCLIVLTVILVSYVIYKRQLSIQRRKSQLINEINQSKLIAIQSQMNPHFIFNALNSIQDLVLKGDIQNSYSYITDFSNLVRKTLNYSDKDYIDFEQELKLLNLYLSLEKLRFKKDFNYSIECFNTEDILIPPLLIQPFVENSLVHGLFHKDGDKELKIVFELKEALTCSIIDNGIGREESKKIKLGQKHAYASFSGKAIEKRFEILSKVNNYNFGYEYIDLYENGTPTGTKVILNIPFKNKF